MHAFRSPAFAPAAAIILGLGALGLGVLSLLHRDFALQWQPYSEAMPGRALWGLASGAVAAVGGLLTIARPTRGAGAAILAVFFGLWVVALHGPVVAAKPASVALWNGLAEAAAMGLGALVVWREVRTGPDRLTALGVRGFGATCVVFGVAHFVYAEFTATMVPAWLPMRLELAYLTGAIHVLTGLALLARIRPAVAAAVEAAMMTSFVALVHLPRIAAKPTDRLELTMGFIALTLAAAAWSIAVSRSAAKERK